MKLLLDENLSPRLIYMLSDICADSNHISYVGLASSDDSAIWDYAKRHAFTIVSKDSDFTIEAYCWEVRLKLSG